jgi:hypothetical protein
VTFFAITSGQSCPEKAPLDKDVKEGGKHARFFEKFEILRPEIGKMAFGGLKSARLVALEPADFSEETQFDNWRLGASFL